MECSIYLFLLLSDKRGDQISLRKKKQKFKKTLPWSDLLKYSVQFCIANLGFMSAELHEVIGRLGFSTGEKQ